MRDRVLSLLGLAQKARALASGNFLVEQAVAKRTARLIIIAVDAASNTRDGLEKITFHYKVPVLYYGSKETLGHALGQSERSCVAILDEGFAKKLKSLIEENSQDQQ